MSVKLVFPVEFFIEDTPISLGGSSTGREKWKNTVGAAAHAKLQEGYWATTGAVHVTILYFPASAMPGDVDNIVKPILDALSKVIYMDDKQVERVWVQKIEPGRPFLITNMTPTLAEAVECPRPVVYIRIDDDVSVGERRWPF